MSLSRSIFEKEGDRPELRLGVMFTMVVIVVIPSKPDCIYRCPTTSRRTIEQSHDHCKALEGVTMVC